MPLRDDLLLPIPGENPSGASLRYDKVYDQIKEARTEDDSSIPTGDWGRTAKKADTALVIKLAGEVLATRSKDLQLAAWLTEAHLKREGFALLTPCLALMRDLQETFWDTIYPEPDEGDFSIRAVPIEWLGNRFAALLRELALTKSGLSYFQYKESRTVGYEADGEASEQKREMRSAAISDGKLTAEEFDSAFNGTPKSFYTGLETTLSEAQEKLTSLEELQDERYGNDSPNMAKLRTSIEEVKQVVTSLLNRKRETEPDEASDNEEPVEATEDSELETQDSELEAQSSSTPTKKKARSSASFAEPQSVDDAYAVIAASARYLRTETPGSPIPYLLATAVRWGELRLAESPSYDFMVAPSTEVRQNLKRLANEESWEELLTESLAALAGPCGRVWLDVHRYIWRAASSYGYSAIAQAVVSSLRTILHDFPAMLQWSLDDDTPTANPETRSWIDSEVLLPEATAASSLETNHYEEEASAASATEATPSVYDTAMEMVHHGKARQAIDLLMRDSAQQPSGRLRFLRRVQVAQLCLTAGQDVVAYPLLKNLADEISTRNLETWESGDMLAQPLSLLLKVLDEKQHTDIDRDKIFTVLCRIDPTAAFGSLG
ncbi:MAG TPA: type VI secretion system protein TssA [Granulicella sp.]